METYLSVQQVKIPSWTCLYSDLSCEIMMLFRKHELVLMSSSFRKLPVYVCLWQAEISLWQFTNAEVTSALL